MLSTATSLMVDVKVEDFVAENTSTSGVLLSSSGRRTHEQWQIVMKSVCMVYDASFQRLLEVVGQPSNKISEGVHDAARDPPYKSCWIAELSNSEHDRLILQHMRHFVELLPALMNLSQHVHTFCTAPQIKT